MQIRNSSDWRDALPFETPLAAAEAVPGDPARCAGCKADVEAYSRDELWVVKHRHPNNPAGFVKFYCAEHRPEPPQRAAEPVTVKSVRARGAAAAPRERRVSAPVIPERVAALCPDCWVEVPPTGVCGMCGQKVA